MKALLEALGVEDEVSALRAIAEATGFINEARATVGKQTFGETLNAIRQNASLSKQVCEATERPAAEAVGVMLAWKASHVALVVGDPESETPPIQEQLAQATAEVEKRDRGALIEKGKADRKLTPASAAFWEDKPVEQLKAFLETAPTIIPALATQPKDGGGNGAGSGKPFDEMTAMERHALWREVGQEAYDAICADAAQRNGGQVPPPVNPLGEKPAD